MLYCHLQPTVLKAHFHLAPKWALFPVSASGCTSSKADSSCSCTLINPHQCRTSLISGNSTAFGSWLPYPNTHELQQFPNISPASKASSHSIHFVYYLLPQSFQISNFNILTFCSDNFGNNPTTCEIMFKLLRQDTQGTTQVGPNLPVIQSAKLD